MVKHTQTIRLNPTMLLEISLQNFVFSVITQLKLTQEKHTSEVYLEPSQTSNMELLKKYLTALNRVL